jgi:predicted esterase
MTDHFHIETPRTARCYTLGDVENASELWIALHGYGNRGESFISLFSPIADTKLYICAPEALSRFYIKGFSGEVGASWMTRSDRQAEINDYVRYIRAVYDTVLSKFTKHPKRIVLFGFSQGVPAILRSIAFQGLKATDIVLWSGDVPRDLDFIKFKQYASDARIWLNIGDADTLVRPEIYAETETLLGSHSIGFTKTVFHGGHTIPPEVLISLANQISA